jgi:hypothetical protein
VRGDLQNGVLDPAIEHLPQGTLHLRGLGCGAGGYAPLTLALVAEHHLRSGHKATLLGPVGDGEDRVQGVGGRGLSIGAGDAIDRQARGRVPKYGARERR